MVDKQVRVRLVMDGGRVVEAQLEGIGTKGKAAFTDLDRASGQMRGNLQNASYQVQDFFVQVASGTDPVRALSQQLPQLLGSLGLFGVLAGTAVAALIPLGGHLLGIGEDSATAEEAIRSLAESTNALNDIAGANLEKLRDKYGEVNAEIVVMLARRLQVERDLAAKSARDAVSAVAAEFEGLQSNIAAYQGFKQSLDDAVANPALLANSNETVWLMTESMAALEEEIGLTYEQMLLLQGAIDAYRGAETMDAQAASAANLLAILEQLGLSAEPFYVSLLAAEEELRATEKAAADAHATVLDLAGSAPGLGWMSDAMASVGGLIGRLMTAVGLRNALAGGGAAASGDGPAFENRGRSGASSGVSLQEVMTIDDYINAGGGGRRGGGGGGGGGGQKAENDLMREAQKLYEQTRTDAEKYTEEVARLDEMLKAGVIDQDLYNRGLERAAEKFGEASGAAAFFKEMNIDIKETLIDVAMEGGDALDGLIEKLKRAAFEAMLFGTGPIADLFGLSDGGIFGDGFTGIFAGGKAAGGDVVRGKAYRVGETGPEVFVPATDGTIFPVDPMSGGKIESGMSASRGIGGGGTSRLMVELGEGLIGRILSKAADQTVEIVERAITANNRHAVPSLARGAAKNPRRV